MRKLKAADADSEKPRRLPHATYVATSAWMFTKRKISYCGEGTAVAGFTPRVRFPPHVWIWITGCDRFRSRGAQRWKRRCSRAGSTIISPAPHAAVLTGAHPLMLRAIAAAKKKNDRIDASKICDCLRCDFLPESYMASTAIRERRRTLRYRNLLVRQMVQMKIKISALLMEAGVSYNKQRLHKAGYFRELLATNPDIDEGLCSLLRLCPRVPWCALWSAIRCW